METRNSRFSETFDSKSQWPYRSQPFLLCFPPFRSLALLKRALVSVNVRPKCFICDGRPFSFTAGLRVSSQILTMTLGERGGVILLKCGCLFLFEVSEILIRLIISVINAVYPPVQDTVTSNC